MVAWVAILAYVAPVAAHGAPRQHEHGLADKSAEHCAGHHDADATPDHTSTVDSATPQALAMEPDEDCAGPRLGSSVCCAAMCAPALPSPFVSSTFVPRLRTSSGSRIAVGIIASFVARLDRPPKPGVASIG